MGRNEIVRVLARESGVTQKDCKKVLEAFVDLLVNSDSEKEIKIRGLGVFYWKEIKGRKGTHPQNPNIIIEIPAKKYLSFRSSKTLSRNSE